jgi:tRNA pseudouridine synthase 9
MSGTLSQRQPSQVVVPATLNGGLKKMPPYWYPYTTMAKERWLGREILEIVSTEFRDRSMEYYVGALSLPCHPCDLDESTAEVRS